MSMEAPSNTSFYYLTLLFCLLFYVRWGLMFYYFQYTKNQITMKDGSWSAQAKEHVKF